MANENTILTALGLDLSQFEDGTKKATGVMRPLLGAISTLDTELRKIPVVGEVYAATFGKIAEGFAETRTQAREFSRIMQTDVSGSFDGALQQIEEINTELNKLREGSFSRAISDKLTSTGDVIKNGATQIRDSIREELGGSKMAQGVKAVGLDLFNGVRLASKAAGNFIDESTPEWMRSLGKWTGKEAASLVGETPQQKRDKQDAELVKKREGDIQALVKTLDLQGSAQSAINSSSQEATDNARIQIQLNERLLSLKQQAQKIGGVDESKWSDKLRESIQGQSKIYEDIATKQKAAAAARRQDRVDELDASVKIAMAVSRENERDIAAEEERLAIAKNLNAIKSGVKEDIEASEKAVQIAYFRREAAQHQYDIAVQQGNLATAQMAAEVNGQTRLAKQLEIQSRYQVQIEEARRHGNTELAKQLVVQQRLAQLSEAIREYKLGGHGRAVERRQERRDLRIAARAEKWDANQSRQRGRQQRALPAAQKPIPTSTIENFMKSVLDSLKKA